MILHDQPSHTAVNCVSVAESTVSLCLSHLFLVGNVVSNSRKVWHFIEFSANCRVFYFILFVLSA